MWRSRLVSAALLGIAFTSSLTARQDGHASLRTLLFVIDDLHLATGGVGITSAVDFRGAMERIIAIGTP
jgi:hypothetical protein